MSPEGSAYDVLVPLSVLAVLVGVALLVAMILFRRQVDQAHDEILARVDQILISFRSDKVIEPALLEADETSPAAWIGFISAPSITQDDLDTWWMLCRQEVESEISLFAVGKERPSVLDAVTSMRVSAGMDDREALPLHSAVDAPDSVRQAALLMGVPRRVFEV